jgi:uncharacterized protein (DUF433 family)
MNAGLVVSDPDILGGTPVFAGTRIPVRVLFERLASGDSLAEILEAYPGLARDQAIAALWEADNLIERAAEHEPSTIRLRLTVH